ncbi:MAG TPA: HAD family hydrolase, partial [Armatimonadota bacterium]
YGRPLRSCYEALYPDGDLDHCIEVHRAFQAGLMHLIRPFPGMTETLAGLRDAGVGTAVVTSRSIRSTRVTLERLGLWDRLDTVVTPEDTQRHKPDPEPLLLAASRLKAQPAECLMVGDTENDLAAGRAAGMATCGVTYGFLGEGILAGRPTYRIACPEGLLNVVGVAR